MGDANPANPPMYELKFNKQYYTPLAYEFVEFKDS